MLKMNFEAEALNRNEKHKGATPMKLIKEILLGTKK